MSDTKNIISLGQLISKLVEKTFSSMRLVISPWRLDLVKRWRINPFTSSNIPASPGYGVYISHLVRYSKPCAQYSDFLDRSQIKLYGGHHHLVDRYELHVPISQITMDLLFFTLIFSFLYHCQEFYRT